MKAATVLLVEEDAALRLLMEKMLLRSGFAVLVAGDAVEGSKVFAGHRDEIGLLIAGLDLPFLSGLEFAAMITSVKPQLPVLIVSGAAGATDLREQIDARGWSFLTKPFAMTELAAKVSVAFSPPPAVAASDKNEVAAPLPRSSGRTAAEGPTRE